MRATTDEGEHMDTPAEWWKPFFSGLWGYVLQHAWTPEQTQADAEFVAQLLQVSPAARILDVPCGEGRISRMLAARRYQVTGVDGTAPFLENARRHADAENLSIQWEQRDMRDLAWHDAFDGAVCWWGSFGYFDDDENEQFLRGLFRALKPGGRLVLETLISETLLPVFQERGWQQIGEMLLLERRWYDYVHSRVGTEWTMLHGGKTETQTTSIRIYTYRELSALFTKVGFILSDAYDTRSRQPFAFGARRLTTVVQKPT